VEKIEHAPAKAATELSPHSLGLTSPQVQSLHARVSVNPP